MVAQVIKLPSAATNNFQSQASAIASKVDNTSAQKLQADQAKAKKNS